MRQKDKTKVPASKALMSGKKVNDGKVAVKTNEGGAKTTKKLVKETKQGCKDYGKN